MVGVHDFRPAADSEQMHVLVVTCLKSAQQSDLVPHSQACCEIEGRSMVPSYEQRYGIHLAAVSLDA